MNPLKTILLVGALACFIAPSQANTSVWEKSQPHLTDSTALAYQGSFLARKASRQGPIHRKEASYVFEGLNMDLYAQLARMEKVDRYYRYLVQDATFTPVQRDSVQAIFTKVVASNVANLKEIIAEYGWPHEDLVEQGGCRAAFWIALHASQDRAFQKRCYRLLKKAVIDGKANPQFLEILKNQL